MFQRLFRSLGRVRSLCRNREFCSFIGVHISLDFCFDGSTGVAAPLLVLVAGSTWSERSEVGGGRGDYCGCYLCYTLTNNRDRAKLTAKDFFLSDRQATVPGAFKSLVAGIGGCLQTSSGFLSATFDPD